MSFQPKNLTNIRRMRGWTYDKVAKELSVGVNRIVMFEDGKSTPDAMEVIALSKLFGVKTKYFYNADVLDGKRRKVEPSSLSIRRW